MLIWSLVKICIHHLSSPLLASSDFNVVFYLLLHNLFLIISPERIKTRRILISLCKIIYQNELNRRRPSYVVVVEMSSALPLKLLLPRTTTLLLPSPFRSDNPDFYRRRSSSSTSSSSQSHSPSLLFSVRRRRSRSSSPSIPMVIADSDCITAFFDSRLICWRLLSHWYRLNSSLHWLRLLLWLTLNLPCGIKKSVTPFVCATDSILPIEIVTSFFFDHQWMLV